MEISIERYNDAILVLRLVQYPSICGRRKPHLAGMHCVYPLFSQQRCEAGPGQAAVSYG